MRKSIFIAAASAACVALSCSAAKLTQKCNTTGATEMFVYGLTAQMQSRIVNAVANPAQDSALYESLWEPRTAQALGTDPAASMFGLGVRLSMDPFQDLAEIDTAMHADSLLQSLGVTQMMQDGTGACFAAGPLPPYDFYLTEYYNTYLGHYFMSSSDAENNAIDSGAAGPGWQRTGQKIVTTADWCADNIPVFRFYGPTAHSHFFTADPQECGFVRSHDPGWIPEGIAAKAWLPVAGACPARAASQPPFTPVYRLYNGRAAQGDPNHRFTTRPDLYQQMMQAGWIGEGVALCIVPSGFAVP